jgi:hypothetical protein
MSRYRRRRVANRRGIINRRRSRSGGFVGISSLSTPFLSSSLWSRSRCLLLCLSVKLLSYRRSISRNWLGLWCLLLLFLLFFCQTLLLPIFFTLIVINSSIFRSLSYLICLVLVPILFPFFIINNITFRPSTFAHSLLLMLIPKLLSSTRIWNKG